MSVRIYISHTDPVHGLVAARQVMESGGYPFVPQLNKLIPGRSDEEWIRYYEMWALQCDVMLLTDSFREHEKEFARSNKIPIARDVYAAMTIKLPPFAELGRRFGEEVADGIKSEAWRDKPKEEVFKDLDVVCGLGCHKSEHMMNVARLALYAWDRMKNG